MHHIGGWYRNVFARFEQSLVSMVSFLSQLSENLYRSNQPIIMLTIVVALSLWVFIGASAGDLMQ